MPYAPMFLCFENGILMSFVCSIRSWHYRKYFLAFVVSLYCGSRSPLTIVVILLTLLNILRITNVRRVYRSCEIPRNPSRYNNTHTCNYTYPARRGHETFRKHIS